MKEQWLPVYRYEGVYEVSDFGRVRRVLGSRGATAGRVLKPAVADGYSFVQLSKGDRKKRLGVHVLVAEAFLDRRRRKKVPNHKNFDKSDNRVSNLEWLTQLQNVRHAAAAGRVGGCSLRGESNGRAKLSSRQVITARRLKGIIGQRDLAILLGVSKTLVQKIHQRKLWQEAT